MCSFQSLDGVKLPKEKWTIIPRRSVLNRKAILPVDGGHRIKNQDFTGFWRIAWGKLRILQSVPLGKPNPTLEPEETIDETPKAPRLDQTVDRRNGNRLSGSTV
jgi:hypothetical protein